MIDEWRMANDDLFLYLEFIISGFQQYSRRVGIAHQIQLIEAVNGGQCPPYANNFMQR